MGPGTIFCRSTDPSHGTLTKVRVTVSVSHYKTCEGMLQPELGGLSIIVGCCPESQWICQTRATDFCLSLGGRQTAMFSPFIRQTCKVSPLQNINCTQVYSHPSFAPWSVTRWEMSIHRTSSLKWSYFEERYFMHPIYSLTWVRSICSKEMLP